MVITGLSLIDSLSKEAFAKMLDNNPSCKGLLVGYMAEQILADKLLCLSGFKSVVKIDDQDDKKGDLDVIFRQDGVEKRFSIEVKCVRSKTGKEPPLTGGVSGNVYTGTSDSIMLEEGGRTSCSLAGAFDVLAVCMVTITGEWDFYFIHQKYMPRSDRYKNRLKPNFAINTLNTPCLHSDIFKVIEDLN